MSAKAAHPRRNALLRQDLSPRETRLTASPRCAAGVNQPADLPVDDESSGAAETATQVAAGSGLVITGPGTGQSPAADPPHGAGYQDGAAAGNHAQLAAPEGITDEIAQQLACLGVNLNQSPVGRKHVFDDFLRGRLVSLLALGLTLRQAGSALGVSHVAVWKEMKRNPELSEQVNAARFQAQIGPLMVVLRESKRSWRAATWLLGYLKNNVQTREETPDEERQRRWDEQAEVNERTAQNNRDFMRRLERARGE